MVDYIKITTFDGKNYPVLLSVFIKKIWSGTKKLRLFSGIVLFREKNLSVLITSYEIRKIGTFVII